MINQYLILFDLMVFGVLNLVATTQLGLQAYGSFQKLQSTFQADQATCGAAAPATDQAATAAKNLSFKNLLDHVKKANNNLAGLQTYNFAAVGGLFLLRRAIWQALGLLSVNCGAFFMKLVNWAMVSVVYRATQNFTEVNQATTDFNAALIFGAAILLALATYGDTSTEVWCAIFSHELLLVVQLVGLLFKACDGLLRDACVFFTAFSDELHIKQQLSALAHDDKHYEFGYAVVEISGGSVATLLRNNVQFKQMLQVICQRQGRGGSLLSRQDSILSADSRQAVFTAALGLERLLDFVCLAAEEHLDGETLNSMLKGALAEGAPLTTDSSYLLFQHAFQPVQPRGHIGGRILRVRIPSLFVEAFLINPLRAAHDKERVYLRIRRAPSDSTTSIYEGSSLTKGSVLDPEQCKEVRFGGIQKHRFARPNTRSASHNNIVRPLVNPQQPSARPQVRRSNSFTNVFLEIQQPELRPLRQNLLIIDKEIKPANPAIVGPREPQLDLPSFAKPPSQPQTNSVPQIEQRSNAPDRAPDQLFFGTSGQAVQPRPAPATPLYEAIPSLQEEEMKSHVKLEGAGEQSAFTVESSSAESSLSCSLKRSSRNAEEQKSNAPSGAILSRPGEKSGSQLPAAPLQSPSKRSERRKSQVSAGPKLTDNSLLSLAPSNCNFQSQSSSASGSAQMSDGSACREQFNNTIKGEICRISLENRKNQSSLLQLENNQQVISQISREFGRKSRLLPVFKSLKPTYKNPLTSGPPNSDPQSKISESQILSVGQEVQYLGTGVVAMFASKQDKDSKSSTSVKTTVTQRLNQNRTFVYKIIHDLRHPTQGLITAVKDLKAFLKFPSELRRQCFSREFAYAEHAVVRKAMATSEMLICFNRSWREDSKYQKTQLPSTRGFGQQQPSRANLTSQASSNKQLRQPDAISDIPSDRQASQLGRAPAVPRTISQLNLFDGSLAGKLSEVSSEHTQTTPSDESSSREPSSSQQNINSQSKAAEQRILAIKRGQRSLEIRRRVFARIKQNFIPQREDFSENLARLRQTFHAIPLERLAPGQAPLERQPGRARPPVRAKPPERPPTPPEEEEKSLTAQSNPDISASAELRRRGSSAEMTFARKRSSSMGASSMARELKSTEKVCGTQLTFGDRGPRLPIEQAPPQSSDKYQSSDSSLLVRPLDFRTNSLARICGRKESHLSLGSVHFSQGKLQLDTSPARKKITSSPLLVKKHRSFAEGIHKDCLSGMQRNQSANTHSNQQTELSLENSGAQARPQIKASAKNLRICLHVIEVLARDRSRLIKQLQKAVKSTDKCVALLENMENQAQMSMSLLKDLMTQAQLNNNTFSFQNAYFDLLALVKSILAMMKPQTREQNVKLVGPVVTSKNSRIFFRQIFADVRRYTQIIVNFVSNAIKFTQRDGQVTVLLHALETEEIRAEAPVSALLADESSPTPAKSPNTLPDKQVDEDLPQEGKSKSAAGGQPATSLKGSSQASEKMVEHRIKFTLIVRDTGIGIAPEDQAKLFKDFGKLADKKKQNAQGVGLGLAICHEIIQKSGGTIGIESEVGHGTDFIITLATKSRCSKCELDKLVQLSCENESDWQSKSTGKDREGFLSSSSQLMGSPRDAEWTRQRLLEHYGLSEVKEELNDDQTYGIDFTDNVELSCPMQAINEEPLEEGRNLDRRMSRSLHDVDIGTPFQEQLHQSQVGLNPIRANNQFDSVERSNEEGEQQASEVSQNSSLKGRIFIANDNTFVLGGMRDITTPYFAVVDTAANGRDTVNSVCSKPPTYYDIILLDIEMPIVRGDEACKLIKAYFERMAAEPERVARFFSRDHEEPMHDVSQSLETPRQPGLPQIYAITAISDPLKIDELRQIGFSDVFEQLSINILKRFMYEAGLPILSPRQKRSSSDCSALLRQQSDQIEPHFDQLDGREQPPNSASHDNQPQNSLPFLHEDVMNEEQKQVSQPSENISVYSKRQRSNSKNKPSSVESKDSSSINASYIQ